ncbi:hypothetical protein C7212DRAFT_355825 [Tuber magnatum]|uniref:Uncharacterized protein n=1 Tax=Tuber magnatum TaxID=42249 RepID=A0A317T4T7_9PEZI|nr:hypothetical protein C7212DRAFT_355825 [Tuber magnatum]
MYNDLSYELMFDDVGRITIGINKKIKKINEKSILSEGNRLASSLACYGWIFGYFLYIEDGWNYSMGDSGYGNSFSSLMAFVL